MTSRTRPTAESTAPRMSNGRCGSAGSGSGTRRASHRMTATSSTWKRKAARQLIAVVIRPPSSGPAAAPMPPMALIAPNARARDGRSVNSRVVRMYTGGISSAVPMPSSRELPMISTPSPGATALSSAPTP